MKVNLPILKFKEGVVVKHGHLQPHITAILAAALETAPITEDGAVWVTEMYRNIRTSIDMHELCSAIDFRCKNILINKPGSPDEQQQERVRLGGLWAERVSAKLGPDYDCVAHGEGPAFHLHVEFDPR